MSPVNVDTKKVIRVGNSFITAYSTMSDTPKRKRGRPRKTEAPQTASKKISSVSSTFIHSGKTKTTRKRRHKTPVTVDNSYKFTGEIETVQFSFSKEGFPYLDFEELKVIPFNTSFDILKPFTYLYIQFTHSSLKKEYTTAGITTSLGSSFQIPNTFMKHFNKKEKVFLQFMRAFAAEYSQITLEELQNLNLEWNKPNKIIMVEI